MNGIVNILILRSLPDVEQDAVFGLEVIMVAVKVVNAALKANLILNEGAG